MPHGEPGVAVLPRSFGYNRKIQVNVQPGRPPFRAATPVFDWVISALRAG